MTRLTDALERARQGNSSDSVTITPDVPAAPRAEERVELQAHEDRRSLFDDSQPSTDDRPDEQRVEAHYHFAQSAAVKLVVGPKPDHTLVEQYRHLAATLHHAQLKDGVRTIMITSAVEAEGKTTTAANIALTLSHSHQRRVLLIDADLRRPSLHTVFQEANRDGLGDYLRDFGPRRKKPEIHQISPTLSLLTAGRPTQDPMSALVSQEMKDLVDEAAEHFDWVIIDTPPVALLSDANLLAGMIDGAILVVRANSTAYPLVQRAQASIGSQRILGVVLNRARRSDLAVGYGYYYYGYSYKPVDQQEPRGLRRLFSRRPQ